MLKIVLSIVGGAAVLGSPLGYRLGVAPLGLALLVLVGGVAISVVAFVLGTMSLVRGTQFGGLGAAVCLLLSAGAAFVPIWTVVSNAGVPAIHDITTDTVDPPLFEAVVPLRRTADNTLDYGGSELATAQKAAYPDLETLVVPASVDVVVARARVVAEELGWEVVSSDPAGRLEATDTTLWFGFQDDVAVRVRPAADGASEVDVRSVSRVGQGDLGTNAKRIRLFLIQLRSTDFS